MNTAGPDLAHEAAAASRLVAFFEAFGPGDLDQLARHYTEDARFKDPFNEVQGLAALRAVYAHMFEQLVAPRFEVHETLLGRDACALTWTFHFASRGAPGRPMRIRGASHLRLADDGRIAEHRDYWDAAEELYEKQPVLGMLLHWLRRRIAAPAA